VPQRNPCSACADGREIFIGNVVDNTSVHEQWVTPAAARIIPFAIFMTFIVAQSLVGDHLQSWGLEVRWLYAARIVMVAAALTWLWRHFSELHDFTGVTARGLACAVAAGIAVFILWINLDFAWARLGDLSGFDPSLADGTGLAFQFVFFRLLGLAIIVPVMEELFWRSFLLRWLEQQNFLLQDPAKVGVRAMFICAALFAVEHNLWLAGIIAGLAYGLVYVIGRSLWLAIISHATTNAALGAWILATRSWQFW
jgi:CAAX prenyl protease-like protein